MAVGEKREFNMVVAPENLPLTLGELKASGYRARSVKDELRGNLMRALREGRALFEGIVGYEKTVVPQIVNALLARHDFILLGLRGQAKTRIARQVVNLLDEWTPVLVGSPIHEDPTAPVLESSRKLIAEEGGATPITWRHRSQRYQEKLATPDVSMADLIGDIDPIKAANLRLDYADERVIHYGIIPRTNRGVFCLNELPDLAPRIQVGLLNIMEERDIQVRGFPVRLPMDVIMVFTANPEDYTNRGSIITPLKDRIESQIHTHYPRELAEALAITQQEAWAERNGQAEGAGAAGESPKVIVPRFLKEAVEFVAFEARKNEFLDQSSGVSARLPIALLECVVSNAERRAVATGVERAVVRPIDFQQGVAAITGKIELVYQGEQQGAMNVARRLVGKGLKAAFDKYLPEVGAGEGGDREADDQVFGPYKPVVDYFGRGGRVEVADDAPEAQVLAVLRMVEGLERLAARHVPMDDTGAELIAAMELVLEGLHQARMIGKDDLDGVVSYYDMLGDVLEGIDKDR